MEGPSHGVLELSDSSEDQRFFGASTMTNMKENGKLIVISGEDIMPIIENKVKEEIRITLQKFRSDQDWNNELAIATSVERSLQLKFLDEVSIPVLTGKELIGKGGAAIRLAVVDKITGKLVASGPGASAKVEILILQANNNEDELNWTIEDFNKRIIRGRNEGKPYFPTEMYVDLEKGMVSLCDVKLGHGSTWVKACLCRLGARVVENFGGSTVKEAWTKSFMVRDYRREYNKKKETPSLSDKICRLRSIWRRGKSYQSMQREKIYTVEDLLIRLLKDYDGLKNIVNLGEKKWEDMVKHARECPTGSRMYCYTNSQRSTIVVFNIHGKILRIYPKRRYAAAQMPSQKNKDIAGDLLSSAICHWEDVIQFDDESLLQQHLSSLGMSVDPSDSMELGYPARPHSIVASEMIGVRSDTSSQGIISNMASTQEVQSECIEPLLNEEDVTIMHDLAPKTTNAIFENFKNVDAGMEGTGSMVTEPFRDRNGEKILTFDDTSTATSSYLSVGENTYSPNTMQPINWMESFRFPSPVTDSFLWDMGSATPQFWNDNLQFSEIDGAKRGWNVLISILALRSSLKRIVARKSRVEVISSY